MTPRPAWLLAFVVAVSVTAVVVLESMGHSDGAQRVVGMVLPVLAALYVADKVKERSDNQDEKLEEHTEALTEVKKAVNGDLTRRLDQANAPLLEQIEELRAEQARVAAALAASQDNPAAPR